MGWSPDCIPMVLGGVITGMMSPSFGSCFPGWIIWTFSIKRTLHLVMYGVIGGILGTLFWWIGSIGLVYASLCIIFSAITPATLIMGWPHLASWPKSFAIASVLVQLMTASKFQNV